MQVNKTECTFADKMDRSQHKPLSVRGFFSLTIAVLFLLLGFCPLRNVLAASLFQNHQSVPKTNGAHLLTGTEHCTLTLAKESTVSDTKRLTVPFAVVMTILFFGSILPEQPFPSLRVFRRFDLKRRPLYLCNRVWRI
ncbi:hypothetical protein EOD41_04335 [Mucilaginibacter limnophilus]|uniref:Uncharacterized protein n=1 Tax=Mucilaginibacter limnophilus TaxID=1932778 RepID=A0A3S2UM91_9SPHI|nr:hypothetical protein [Mucilaginibacter limnophilus]RVU01202.1 hypothetical protein EOD41_04335 [Mucilaginibacter limnophilus]